MGKKRKWKIGRKKWTLKIFLFRLIVVAAIAVIIGAEFVRLTDMSDFVDTFYVVDDEKIKNPMRIAVLSDLHLQEFGKNNIRLVDEIRKLKPDIIAMVGDMMNQNDPDVSVVITLCRQLVDVAPVYFSYGNHEKEAIRVKQTSTLNADLEKMGVHVLHNRYETIEVNGNLIDIGGLSANPGTENADYTQRFWQKYIKTANYHLLLVHYPQFFFFF